MGRLQRPVVAVLVGIALVAAACDGSTASGSLPPSASLPSATAAQPLLTPTPTKTPTPTVTPKPVLRLAIDLPLEGNELAASQPIINGARLAVKQAGGQVRGYTVEIPNAVIYDDAFDGSHDPQTGAQNMVRIVADPTVVGVIGPLNSSVAKVQIPISNNAGLAQCSPSNTNPSLTKGQAAAQLRNKPNNYVRVMTTDDIQGPAMARYVLDTLRLHRVYVIDDAETFGSGVADAFAAEFEARGGVVTRHDSVPKLDARYDVILKAAKAGKPQAIYFGGVTGSGGAAILLAAKAVGLGGIPFIGADGINDGSASLRDSFLNLVGPAAAKAKSTLAGGASIPDWPAFNALYRGEYGVDSVGYAPQGYACAQVLLDALDRALATQPTSPDALREKVRVALTDPTRTYETSLGSLTFDANGDTSLKVVSVWQYDATSEDWRWEADVPYPTGG